MNLFSLKGVLTVVAAAAFMLVPDCGRAGSLDNYDKVKNGMSRSEVDSLLGKATKEAGNTFEVNRGLASRVSLTVVRISCSVLTTMPEKVATDIEALPAVAAVCPGLVAINPVDELGDDPILIQGWPAGKDQFGELKATAGEILSKKNLGQHAVIVGQGLAKLKSVKVGDKLTIADEKFHVVGIFASLLDMENDMVLMQLPEAQRTFGHLREITGCTVDLKDKSAENVDKVAKIIETTIAEASGMKGKIKARPFQQSFGGMSMACWKDEKRVVCITFVNGKVALTALVRL